jgi:hypothetical protein
LTNVTLLMWKVTMKREIFVADADAFADWKAAFRRLHWMTS